MVSAFAALLALTAQAPRVTLTYFEEHFIVRDGSFSESAPLKLAPETPRLSTLFRKNSTFAVWDERGLTIRAAGKAHSTKLPDVVTSPRAFSRDEILANRAAIKKGLRTKDVGALSGAVRVGNRVYFLARWVGKDGKPWAEALVDVDLSVKNPEPKMLGRPHAMSLSNKTIDDKVFILDGKLSYVARSGKRWGIEQFEPRSGRFSFDELGDRLESYEPVASERKPPTGHLGLFVERTNYGTTVAGRVDLHTRFRKTLAETRSKIRFLDGANPPCLIMSGPGDQTKVLNGATGAVFELSVPCSLRRSSRGLIVWTPTDTPKRAWLYSFERWNGLAWWNSERRSSGEGG